MKNKTLSNVQVGAFVLAGVLFLVFTLYMIGRNRNLLGATFTIHALVTNVNGLVPGNNVRYKGIDVGTVKSVRVESDTVIIVTMLIDERMQPFLKKNAIASIGTDGLMGNRLININSQPGPSAPIEPGDSIQSMKPAETDEMLRTLNTTNKNIEKITHNLYEITVKLNSSQSLWSILADTVITRDIKQTMVDLRRAGSNTVELTRSAKALMNKMETGDGLAQKLFIDTVLSQQLVVSLKQLEEATQKTSTTVSDLQLMVGEVKAGKGTAGLLLTDSTLRQQLSTSIDNVEQGTARFNENMEALKSNFLFRRYFKKLEKESKEKKKN
ncbi:MAG: MlaD family protein [Bacteroidota bacterium]